MKHDAKTMLCWVIVDGEIHNVEEYASLTPRQRPPAMCPVCKRPVTLRLGPIRAFHAAHQPDDICAVTQPETSLHINTKYYLYNQLRSMTKIIVDLRCNGLNGEQGYPYWKECAKASTKPTVYFKGWDEVVVEHQLDQFRPDITLRRNGQVIGAVEVLVTHSVEPNKAKYFGALSIPWIEVDAEDVLPADDDPWSAGDPLPYQRLNLSTSRNRGFALLARNA